MEGDRVITAKLPASLVTKLDEVALRMDRSKSWIIRQTLAEWLADEERRYELTLAALDDVDVGRLLTTEEVEGHLAKKRAERA